MKPFIAKADLVDGVYYEGDCRNASVAVWDAENNVFWYNRYKFGGYFYEAINHPENDDGHDLFYPYGVTEPKELQKVDFESAKMFHENYLRAKVRWEGKE
jgi:hypothetical protein